MANLKSLLDKATSDDFDPNNPGMSRNKFYNCQVSFATTCGISHNRDQCKHEFCWTPEPDVNKIKIQMWGGGGGAAGVCCCQWGFSGGGGAYAELSEIDISNCKTEYRICIGLPSCCSPVFSCGYRGCKTYINNGYLKKADGVTDATNFCAEGGVVGCSLCFMFNCIGCGTCLDPRYDCCCACHYDADVGFPGKLGGIATHCSNNNACWYKHYTTLPAYLETCGYRYDMNRFCAYNMPGGWDGCRAGYGYLPGGGGSHQSVPGKGGISGSALGGNCYCGGPGGPGFVRINMFT